MRFRVDANNVIMRTRTFFYSYRVYSTETFASFLLFTQMKTTTRWNENKIQEVETTRFTAILQRQAIYFFQS